MTTMLPHTSAFAADLTPDSPPDLSKESEKGFQFDPQRVHSASDVFEVFAADHKQQSHMEGHLHSAYEGILWTAAGLQFRITDRYKLKQSLLSHGHFVSTLQERAEELATGQVLASQPVIFDSRAATLPNWNILFIFQAEQMDVKLRVEDYSFYYDCHMNRIQRADGRLRRSRSVDVNGEKNTDTWYQCSMSAARIVATMHLQQIGDGLFNPYVQTCVLSRVKNFCLYSEEGTWRIDITGANLSCHFDMQGNLESLHVHGTKGQQVRMTIRQDEIERQYLATQIRVTLKQGIVKSIHTSSDSILSEKRVTGAIRPCLQPQVE